MTVSLPLLAVKIISCTHESDLKPRIKIIMLLLYWNKGLSSNTTSDDFYFLMRYLGECLHV